MSLHPFHLGVSLLSQRFPCHSPAKARQAEDLGYDIVQVPDHLGLPAPFPALVSAAGKRGEGTPGYLCAQREFLPACPAGQGHRRDQPAPRRAT